MSYTKTQTENGSSQPLTNGNASNGSAVLNGKTGKTSKTLVVPPQSMSLQALREALPRDLFHRSLLTSTLYTVYNLAVVLSLFFATYYLVNNVLHPSLRIPVLIAYGVLQGIIATGLWVIAHECGHQAFSESETINDAVGLVLHSLLLVPYHAWKISHRLHHQNTSHMSKDQVFVPRTKSQCSSDQEFHLRPTLKVQEPSADHKKTDGDSPAVDSNGKLAKDSIYEIHDAPIVQTGVYLITLAAMLLVGWPLYLIFNVSGQKYGRWASHFTPSSPIFNGQHNREIIVSNIALATVFAILGYASYVTSPLTVFAYFGHPYLWVNFWLITITFLHHTDPIVPHYRDGQWTYVRGALATVDRDYGWFINHFQHHIADTHVVHHLFSRIPHYNATKATKILAPILGENYLKDEGSFVSALWRNFCLCRYVDDEGDILFYKSS